MTNTPDLHAIRLVILTAMPLYGRAIQALDGRGRLRVVATRDATPDMEPQRVLALRPDVIVFDLNESRGSTALFVVPEGLRDVRSVAVMPSTPRPAEIMSCLRARVAGYVSAYDQPDDVVSTIEGVARGELRCAPRASVTVLDLLATLAPRDAPRHESGLTARELEVLELLQCGLSNLQIADQLSIELSTVKNHVHSILKKLRLSRRTEVLAR